MSMVSACRASTTPKAGISSPAGCTEISNLPPDNALTVCDSFSALPKMVSSERGKLEARRQRTAACACTAGATPAANTPARPALFTIERRSIEIAPDCLKKLEGKGTAYCMGTRQGTLILLISTASQRPDRRGFSLDGRGFVTRPALPSHGDHLRP